MFSSCDHSDVRISNLVIWTSAKLGKWRNLSQNVYIWKRHLLTPQTAPSALLHTPMVWNHIVISRGNESHTHLPFRSGSGSHVRPSLTACLLIHRQPSGLNSVQLLMFVTFHVVSAVLYQQSAVCCCNFIVNDATFFFFPYSSSFVGFCTSWQSITRPKKQWVLLEIFP